LRDDVSELFHSLVDLMKARRLLLGEFLRSIREKRHTLKSGDILKLQAMNERDVLRIEEIDLLGADMAAVKSRILAVCGLPDDGDFDARFRESGEPLFDEYRALGNDFTAITAEAARENDRLLGELEESLGQTGRDMEDIRRIRHLTGRLGKEGNES